MDKLSLFQTAPATARTWRNKEVGGVCAREVRRFRTQS